jgi:predicted nucleic acid-binding protein
LEQRLELLGFYLPYCQTIEKIQIFLDLAESGRADVLVTGDLDLLTLAGQTRCLIETPEVYRQRV